MKVVLALTMGVSLDDDGAHVVVKHLAWHAANGGKGMFMISPQGLEPFVGDELDIREPAIALADR